MLNEPTYRMLRRWAAYLTFLSAFFLSGCATFPKAYHLHPELAAEVQTKDKEEIRRRWGDYSHLEGKYWIGDRGWSSFFTTMQWVTKGASATFEYWSCDGDSCNQTQRLVQYNPVEKSLEYMIDDNPNSTEHRYRKVRTDTVAPDGVVGGFWENWKYNPSSNTFQIDDLKLHEISKQQYTETIERLKLAAADNSRRQKAEGGGFWSAMATGMTVLGQAAAETSQTYSAQRAQSAARDRAFQNSLNAAAAKDRERIANEQAQLRLKQQQQAQRQAAQLQATAQAQAAAGNRQAALQAQAAQRAAEARARAAASDAERQRRLAEQERRARLNAQQQARSATVPSAPFNLAATDKPAAQRTVDTKAAPVSRGPARAWCMQKKNGEYWCNGPLQNGGWGKTLKGALKMVDCTDGNGFTPTIGNGGERFNCGRELRASERSMPASDPFRNR